MSSTAAIGLILFLVGGLLGVLLLIARTTSEIPSPDNAGLTIEPNPESERIGDTVILAVAIMSLFAALIGLWLLVGTSG
jgi:uncharacterized iron-regulated membrane protein